MIRDLKPYPAYKPSGVEWLGEVPEHWQVLRLKSAVAHINDQTVERSPDDAYIALEHVESWTGRLRFPKNGVGFDSQVKRFKPNDVLFSRLRPYLAKVTRPTVCGVCVGEFLVLRPKGSSVSPVFLESMLRSKPIIDAVNSSTYGAKMPRADWGFVGSMLFPLPPLPEQSAIVRFLDHVDRRIRRYILAKQKLITLLNEQKQAIIHHAVTCGLNPKVRLKSSGVEGLGDVPEHWKVVRLKDVAVVQTGLTLGKTYRGVETELRPYLRVANVQHGRLDLSTVKRVSVPPWEVARTLLRPGDVLMTEGGDIDKLGRGSVWRDEIPGCLHQNHIFAVRCQPQRVISEFLVYLMVSQHGRAYFQLTAKQTTNLASTNSTTLRAFPIPLPPVLEQRAILAEVAKLTAGIDAATTHTEREIALLREYRTRLIADVVTGKLDVREVAAGLPEEVEEPEAVDEAEALDEGESEEGTEFEVAAEGVDS